MTSSTYFFGLLLFVVLAKGFIQLNEPFLVALCFVAFITTVHLRFGNAIYESFNARYVAMVATDREYIKNYRAILKQVIDLYKSRILLYRRLHRLGRFFRAQTKQYIKIREQDLMNQVANDIHFQLELLNQKENNFKTQFQQELVTKFIMELKNQNRVNSIVESEISELTYNDLQNFLTQK